MPILKDIQGDERGLSDKLPSTKVRTEVETALESIIFTYQLWLAMEHEPHYERGTPESAHRLFRMDGVIPTQSVDDFSLRLGSYKDMRNFEHTGYFLNALIQHAYSCGANGFNIDLRVLNEDIADEDNPKVPHRDFLTWHLKTELRGIGQGLCGTEHAKLEYSVRGVLGEKAGSRMRFCKATFHDEVGDYSANHSQYCDITFLGSIGYRNGQDSSSCVFRAKMEETYQQLLHTTMDECSVEKI